jgi:hypothetical protein
MAPPFLTSALDTGEWSASRPSRFTSGTHCVERCMGPRAGLDAMENREWNPVVQPVARRYTDFYIVMNNTRFNIR